MEPYDPWRRVRQHQSPARPLPFGVERLFEVPKRVFQGALALEPEMPSRSAQRIEQEHAPARMGRLVQDIDEGFPLDTGVDAQGESRPVEALPRRPLVADGLKDDAELGGHGLTPILADEIPWQGPLRFFQQQPANGF